MNLFITNTAFHFHCFYQLFGLVFFILTFHCYNYTIYYTQWINKSKQLIICYLSVYINIFHYIQFLLLQTWSMFFPVLIWHHISCTSLEQEFLLVQSLQLTLRWMGNTKWTSLTRYARPPWLKLVSMGFTIDLFTDFRDKKMKKQVCGPNATAASKQISWINRDDCCWAAIDF